MEGLLVGKQYGSYGCCVGRGEAHSGQAMLGCTGVVECKIFVFHSSNPLVHLPCQPVHPWHVRIVGYLKLLKVLYAFVLCRGSRLMHGKTTVGLHYG